ncbi:ABC transporter substrate-binding protein [Streptomyces ipomoeae]|uniref:ABC transporter substrate-binding protein n=1 Tax=Streptomyces ipomoeae TaxID=103232 RepID=UPI001146DC4E|nr:ABC transporter substrate-binding protein [Streptomyces ipomoeae]MDX2939475.1 ABC transporter substrate-binding protein [Streptomyces ipomoeae]TQE25353.1 carbohydrate ABC transporter substrate-binding protein [Streptomyces ipomoeae]
MSPRNHLPRIVALCAAMTTAFGLSACSSSGGTGSADGLTLWYRPGSVPTSAIEGVQKQFPDVKLKLVKVPDLETKLKLALQTGTGAPDIAVIGNDISSYASIETKFADLKSLGADPAKDYVTWKWANGTTPNGRVIGFPIDTGPQGLFYRTDLFAKAGLPTDPEKVSALVSTWDGYRTLAEKASKAGFKACDDASQVYNLHLQQKGQGYFTSSNKYIGDNALSREAFDYSAKLLTDGLCTKTTAYTTDWSSAVAQNKLGAFVGPVYEGPLISSAGSPSGVWRVAQPPGGAGSSGGSFLSILSSAKDKKNAFAVVKWMMNAANQTSGYLKDGLFPSSLGALDDAKLTAAQPYYGGQKVGAVFAEVVKDSPTLYVAPQNSFAESTIQGGLISVRDGKASAASAWKKAQATISKQLSEG